MFLDLAFTGACLGLCIRVHAKRARPRRCVTALAHAGVGLCLDTAWLLANDITRGMWGARFLEESSRFLANAMRARSIMMPVVGVLCVALKTWHARAFGAAPDDDSDDEINYADFKFDDGRGDDEEEEGFIYAGGRRAETDRIARDIHGTELTPSQAARRAELLRKKVGEIGALERHGVAPSGWLYEGIRRARAANAAEEREREAAAAAAAGAAAASDLSSPGGYGSSPYEISPYETYNGDSLEESDDGSSGGGGGGDDGDGGGYVSREGDDEEEEEPPPPRAAANSLTVTDIGLSTTDDEGSASPGDADESDEEQLVMVI